MFSAVFINKEEEWQTITPSNYFSLIDTSHYINAIPNSCWGGIVQIACKNKIKRNKSQLISRVKSDQFTCSYTYDQYNNIKTAKIGFIGVGNLGQAIMRAFIESGEVSPENIMASNRTERKLNKVVEEFSIQPISDNEELVEKSDIIRANPICLFL